MAGPVGFEPTILGSLHSEIESSEGPRLGPGSTTGPATISGLLALLLPCAMRREPWVQRKSRKFPAENQKFRSGGDTALLEILRLRSGGRIEDGYFHLQTKTRS